MMINLLSQGLTTEIENSVGTSLVKYLSSSDYKSFTFISAFASEAGINGLAQYIEQAKKTYESLNIIVGVDQKSTSKEALEALLNLKINTQIFHQRGFSIFHPKIYLFEGEQRSQLIVGSSNLTVQGLFVNVEASIHLELDHDNLKDQQVILDLKTRFAGLFDFSDPNLQPITTELIEQFVVEKIVPTEAERKEIQKKADELAAQASEPIERIIRTIFPRRQLPTAPKEFRSKGTGKAVPPGGGNDEVSPEVTVSESIPTGDFTLVWRRRTLPASSVEIAGTENTNPTGGLRLVQDKFQVGGEIIDQTTYFRNTVFGDLPWATERILPLVEKAIGKFYVSILSEDLGMIPLEIRHKPTGEAGQHNYTTSISWGRLSKTIREMMLTGRTLNLYRSEDADDTFKIEII